LKEYLIGTGGWAYFKIPRIQPLVAYSRAFNFVEVNSTFYQIPPLEEVEKWRKLVPSDFQFSVRAHRAITHKHKLQSTTESLETFERMKRICNTLGADILHLQTPSTLKMTQNTISDMHNFLASISLGGLRLALETRSISKKNLPTELVKFMQDNNIVHCVDLSRGEMPAYESDILYTRLFGKEEHNIYQPTDQELTEIDEKATNGNFEKVRMSFHFVRMYKDAARLKIYKQTGKFPSITNSTGLTSLEDVLSEDTSFPISKQELTQSQGWKLFDLTKERRVHAGDYLQQLPERTYNDMSDILEALRSRLEV
jgi:uncharacterized protein YecE (DUF72 family)